MSDWTPGPWIWRECQGKYLVPISHAKRPLGFSIYEKQNRDYYAMVIATPGSWGAKSPKEREANANLIAAAPRMYDALKLLVDDIREGKTIRNTSPKMRIACEALLAARGEV